MAQQPVPERLPGRSGIRLELRHDPFAQPRLGQLALQRSQLSRNGLPRGRGRQHQKPSLVSEHPTYIAEQSRLCRCLALIEPAVGELGPDELMALCLRLRQRPVGLQVNHAKGIGRFRELGPGPLPS